jgi:hypothetical protein
MSALCYPMAQYVVDRFCPFDFCTFFSSPSFQDPRHLLRLQLELSSDLLRTESVLAGLHHG